MDGLSLGGVESAVLTQGIAFLYAQAGEVLRRRRAAKDRAAASGSLPPEALPTLELPGTVFVHPELEALAASPEAVDRLAGGLRKAFQEVNEYLASDFPADTPALAAADRLRCLLEEVYGTRLTFRGEQRDDGSPPVTQVRAPQAGVVLSGDVRVYGNVAGRNIINKK